jgi:5-oxoprolinase (ATP-hydrolysing)
MGWQFWIDRGGTFTDIVARAPDGALITRKVLSEDSARYADAAVYGLRAILGLAPDAPIPVADIEAIKVGTTVATNALLERKGARTALAVTAGFANALRIGTQHRPRLFDLRIVLPDLLYGAAVEIRERISAEGAILTPLDVAHARAAFADLRAQGYEALAIVLMHADRFPAHEQALERIARAAGFAQVSASHRVSPVMKLVGRGDTTVADAYLSPVVSRYVRQLARHVGGARLFFMQSSGSLADAARFHGKDAVLSGPAGGVIGVAETARAAGFARIIGFDMGGTSTDVSHVAGEVEKAYDTTVAGVRLRVPMMSIHTVAAGGGSVCAFDGLRLRVGPESAGASPGPACYGKGGPLTVTDCNVLLGKIQPEFFPAAFGASGDQPIDAAPVERQFAALAAAVGGGRTPVQLAENFIAIAVDNMARAIKRISIEQGHDIAGYALACFGGAGGQHACLVAEALDLETVILHPLAGVLSAFGIGLARPGVTRQQSLELPLSPAHLPQIAAAVGRLAQAARDELTRDSEIREVRIVTRAHLRAPGSDTALAVAWGDLDAMRRAFAAAYRARFGFAGPLEGLICERVEIEAYDDAAMAPPTAWTPPAEAGTAVRTVRLVSRGTAHAAPVYQRETIAPGQVIAGPALIAETTATTVVEQGWRAAVAPDGHLVLSRDGTDRPRRSVGTARDPALLEIFNNLFMSIAERMGAVLQSTAQSVNIKERLDFSCALFDGLGRLVVNAPHMPVHLGSMGDSVRAVREHHAATLRPGDSYVLNSPYDGGTHLPDITVVTPVFVGDGPAPDFYVASRGHHADIGGLTPGSMPPMSTTIADEGVLLDNLLLVRDGEFLDQAIRRHLGAGPHPARNPDQNIADLKAQAAANAVGAAELAAVCRHYGRDVVGAYMGHVQDYAEDAVRRAIAKLSSGRHRCAMDDGGVVAVSVTIDRARRAAVVDFAGTSPQRPTNFNAPKSICRAAVLYVFRTLIDEDIPLNDGCMRPITLLIPPGSMLDPRPPAAVVAGNVETSQIVCDALYGALGVLAASQGTMNNFTFGDARHQYYETICGGAGAGDGFAGASAVQTHMTNSRLTDPEVLEARYPVVVERFGIRRGSGGRGRYTGGDGVERRIRFLAPMTASILSGRRATRPFGLNGGEDALPGETIVTRANGAEERLPATASVTVAPGDAITIRTPGGGGFGAAD